MESEGSLPCSKDPVTGLSPETFGYTIVYSTSTRRAMRRS